MLTVKVYQYRNSISDALKSPIAVWTSKAKDLVFSTKNPGGYAQCSFRLNISSNEAMHIYANYHHYFVDIGDGAGNTVWIGRIESVTYEPGQATIECEGLWSNAFDAFYDDGSFTGNPGAEHSLLNADSTREFNSTYVALAQSFRLAEPLAIMDIAVRLTNNGSAAPGDYIRVSLRDDNGGSPSSNLLTYVDIQAETIGSTETVFTGITTSYRLNSDTDYWIVINGGSYSTPDSIGWRYDSGSGYTDGTMKYYTSSWAAFSGDAIFYVWTHPRFYYYSADFKNGSFEDTASNGDFDYWTENEGTGTIVNATSNYYDGVLAARLNAGSSTDTYLYQYVPVVKGSDYTLSFYTRGDGTYGGRYKIYDLTNSADIVAITDTGITGTTYTLVEVDFTVPSTCEFIQVYFYCPSTNGGYSYVDAASIDGDYSTSVDVIYDAITQCHFIRNSTENFNDSGISQVNPISFHNNEKPGDAIMKVLSFGSSKTGSGESVGLFCGVYNDFYLKLDQIDAGNVWYVTQRDMLVGEQAMAITSTLSDMKTRVATLYSDSVGSRSITTWNIIEEMYSRFGYHRDGVFSIAGATEAIADIISSLLAKVYSKPGGAFALTLGSTVRTKSGSVEPSYKVKAGDIVSLKSVYPQSVQNSLNYYDVDTIYVKETSYDAEANRLTIVPSNMNMTLVDTILALAGLSGGSMV